MHRFPGNVRELDNEILRAAALTPTGVAIPAEAFSPRVREAAPAAMAPPSGRVMPLRDVVSRAERAAIEAALAETRGNVTEAARLLDVTRPGLYKVMERLGLK
jgi:DNA-binding NtrC family response regulator